METKICSRCGCEKPIKEFKSIKDIRLKVCISCGKKAKKAKIEALKGFNESVQDTINELRKDIRMAQEIIKKKDKTLTEMQFRYDKLLTDIKVVIEDYTPENKRRKIIKCSDCGELVYTTGVGQERCNKCRAIRKKEIHALACARHFQNNKEQHYEKKRRYIKGETYRLKCANKSELKRIERERRGWAPYISQNPITQKERREQLHDCIIRGRLKAEGWDVSQITPEHIAIKRCIIKIKRKK